MFLTLAAAHSQAYYDEVTVCGNCAEVCRKLDSVRASGFPDADGAATTGGGGGDGGAMSGPGPPPLPRPRSEPLPESIPVLATLLGTERRPGTAASGRGTDAAGPSLRGGPRGGADDATVGTAPEAESTVNDGLGWEEGGGAHSSVKPSPKGRPKHASSRSGSSEEGSALESGANAPGGTPFGAGPESDNIDGIVPEAIGVPSVVAATAARSRDQKVSSTRRDKVRFVSMKTGGGAQDHSPKMATGPTYTWRADVNVAWEKQCNAKRP